MPRAASALQTRSGCPLNQTIKQGIGPSIRRHRFPVSLWILAALSTCESLAAALARLSKARMRSVDPIFRLPSWPGRQARALEMRQEVLNMRGAAPSVIGLDVVSDQMRGRSGPFSFWVNGRNPLFLCGYRSSYTPCRLAAAHRRYPFPPMMVRNAQSA